MSLQPPRKSSAGYHLALTPPVVAPALRWDTSGTWILTAEWSTWANTQRTQLLAAILAQPKWFSKSPRRDVLESLFAPWVAIVDRGTRSILSCTTPVMPGTPRSSGTARWSLEGLMMNTTAITPVWKIADFQQDPDQDTISIFGDDADTVEDEYETREISFDELEDMPPATGGGGGTTELPTRIRSREWETRRFMAKERVREARLKAQIAVRMAEREEDRFYRQFGDLDDAESHFSEYDLSEDEMDESDDGGLETPNEVDLH